MRTRFICSMDNEAVLKVFFRFKDDELTITKAPDGSTNKRNCKGSQGDGLWDNI